MEKETRYKEIIESNKDRIFRICCGYLCDQGERKDVYQEIIINIWKSLDPFRGQSQMSTWIYRIAVNTCLSYIRSETRRRRHIDLEASIAIDWIRRETMMRDWKNFRDFREDGRMLGGASHASSSP